MTEEVALASTHATIGTTTVDAGGGGGGGGRRKSKGKQPATESDHQKRRRLLKGTPGLTAVQEKMAALQQRSDSSAANPTNGTTAQAMQYSLYSDQTKLKYDKVIKQFILFVDNHATDPNDDYRTHIVEFSDGTKVYATEHNVAKWFGDGTARSASDCITNRDAFNVNNRRGKAGYASYNGVSGTYLDSAWAAALARADQESTYRVLQDLCREQNLDDARGKQIKSPDGASHFRLISSAKGKERQGQSSSVVAHAKKVLRKKKAVHLTELATGTYNEGIEHSTMAALSNTVIPMLSIKHELWDAERGKAHSMLQTYVECLLATQTGSRGEFLRAMAQAGLFVKSMEKRLLGCDRRAIGHVLSVGFVAKKDKRSTEPVKTGVVPHIDVQYDSIVWIVLLQIFKHCVIGRVSHFAIDTEEAWKQVPLFPKPSSHNQFEEQAGMTGRWKDMFDQSGVEDRSHKAVTHLCRKAAEQNANIAGSNQTETDKAMRHGSLGSNAAYMLEMSPSFMLIQAGHHSDGVGKVLMVDVGMAILKAASDDEYSLLLAAIKSAFVGTEVSIEHKLIIESRPPKLQDEGWNMMTFFQAAADLAPYALCRFVELFDIDPTLFIFQAERSPLKLQQTQWEKFRKLAATNHAAQTDGLLVEAAKNKANEALVQETSNLKQQIKTLTEASAKQNLVQQQMLAAMQDLVSLQRHTESPPPADRVSQPTAGGAAAAAQPTAHPVQPLPTPPTTAQSPTLAPTNDAISLNANDHQSNGPVGSKQPKYTLMGLQKLTFQQFVLNWWQPNPLLGKPSFHWLELKTGGQGQWRKGHNSTKSTVSLHKKAAILVQTRANIDKSGADTAAAALETEYEAFVKTSPLKKRREDFVAIELKKYVGQGAESVAGTHLSNASTVYQMKMF
jgi:hypothetical protein